MMNDELTDRVVNKIFRRDELLPPSLEVLPLPSISVTEPPPLPPVKKKKPSKFFRGVFRIGGTPFFEKHLTTLFYGPRSQGKSLHQAKTVLAILQYLDGMYRLFPELPQAIVCSNQKFNPKIEADYLGTRLFYWESIQQLRWCPRTDCWKAETETKKLFGKVVTRTKQHRLHDCYAIIDDAASIIPADGWQDLPRWFRKLWAQAGHNGIHCLANIQDPLSCDINFRRYVDLCFKVSKIMGNRRPEAGKPPVNMIWGVYTTREVPAEQLWMYGDKSEEQIEEERARQLEEEAMLKEAGKKIFRKVNKNIWKRRYHLIRRKDTEIYDTLQNVPEWMPDTMDHREIRCINPKCKAVHVRHSVV